MSDLTITRPPEKEWLRERLPDAAREKIEALHQAKADAYSLLRGTMDKVTEYRDTLGDAEKQLRVMREQYDSGQLQRHRFPEGGHGRTNERYEIAPDDDRLAAAKEKVAKARAALNRHNSLNEARSARWQALGQLLNHVEKYVEGIPSDARLDLAQPVKAQLRKGESAVAAIERTRRTLEKLHDEQNNIRRAPISSARAKEKARAQIRQLAESAAPNVVGLIEGRGDLEFPKARELLRLHGMARSGDGHIDVHSGGPVYYHDPVALLAWMFGDDLIARIDEEIDAVADDGAALDDATRAQRIAAIDVEILECQREEEAATLAAIDAGIEIERRGDIDPRAFLNLSDDAPAPRT